MRKAVAADFLMMRSGAIEWIASGTPNHREPQNFEGPKLLWSVNQL